MSCNQWDGTAWCHTTAGVRQYLPGPRCAAHTPAKLAGRAAHATDPERGAEALAARARQVREDNR